MKNKKVLLLIPALLFGIMSMNACTKKYNDDNTDDDNVSDTYYESVRGLKGQELLNGLKALTTSKHTTKVSYSGLANYYLQSDGHSLGNTYVAGYYTGNPFVFEKNFNGRINREHVWCQSYLGTYDQSGPGSDLYNVHPAEKKLNEKRGNLYFDVVSEGTIDYETDEGGTARKTECLYSDVAFDPNNIYRGDIARSLFYVATRYADDGYLLSDTPNGTALTMGKLSTLLSWNQEYGPSDLENNRNKETEKIQGNRNPFIDHPEFATMIWDSTYDGAGALNDLTVTIGKKLTTLSFSGTLAETKFTEGEEFDPTGLTVTAIYSDGSTKVLDNEVVRWLDHSSKSSLLSKDMTCVDAYYCGTITTYEGIEVLENTTTYTRVNSVDELSDGMLFAIGVASKSIAMTSTFNSATKHYFESTVATFTGDKMTTVPTNIAIATLHSVDGGWSFTIDGHVIGASTDKTMSQDSGTTVWTISFDSSYNVSLTNTYGTLKYNPSSPRFTVYGSSASGMVLPQMYKVSMS